MSTITINRQSIDAINNRNNNNNDQCKRKRLFPYEINVVNSDLNRQMMKDFTGEDQGFVQVGPKKYLLPYRYIDEAENFYNFEVRKDDVWIVTFPRSGTTWTQEMLWLIASDFNYERASEVPLTTRFPFLEFSMFVSSGMKKSLIEENSNEELKPILEQIDYPSWKILQKMSERRFIKTHLPFSLLPPNLLEVGCKVVYVARNPKDVAASFYHHSRLFRTQGCTTDFPTYWNYFENNLVHWSPFWDHVQEGWERRNNPNLLFLFYEDLNKTLQNLHDGIKRVSTFLGTDLSDKQMHTLEEHLKFENFRNNQSVNFDNFKQFNIFNKGEQQFVRKGKTGGWRDDFTSELSARADKWIGDNLRNTTLRFPE